MTINPQRAQAVFLTALNVSEATARRELLDRECGDDVALRKRVEALLAAHDATDFDDVLSKASSDASLGSSFNASVLPDSDRIPNRRLQ